MKPETHKTIRDFGWLGVGMIILILGCAGSNIIESVGHALAEVIHGPAPCDCSKESENVIGK